MLTVSHLDHLVLRVTNLPAMLDFYTGVPGCPVEKVLEDLGLYQRGCCTGSESWRRAERKQIRFRDVCIW